MYRSLYWRIATRIHPLHWWRAGHAGPSLFSLLDRTDAAMAENLTQAVSTELAAYDFYANELDLDQFLKRRYSRPRIVPGDDRRLARC